MKIALVSTYPPQHCGVGSYAEHLAAGYRSNCVEVQVFAESDLSVDLGYGTVLERSWNRHTYDPKALAEKILASNPDAIDIQHEFGIWPSTSKFAALVGLLQKPTLVTLHTMRPHARLWGTDAKFIVHNLFSALTAPGNTFVLPHPTPVLTRTSAPTPGLAVIPGFIDRSKGYATILEALQRCDYNLLIAGEGKRESILDLSELIYQHGVEDRVMLQTEFLSDAERIDVLSSAEVLILNRFVKTIHGSASGVVRDAIALGIPVVASNHPMHGDLPETVSPRFDTAAELGDILKRSPWRSSWWLSLVSGHYRAARSWTYELAAKARLELL